jgi:murein DD-endopeptidase MepM/ murein hydrolase activator NlpD
MIDRLLNSQVRFGMPAPSLLRGLGIWCLLLSVGVVLGACAHAPPPWLQNTSSSGSSFRGPPPPAVVVQRGDTVYGISRRYGVPVKDIIQVNRLSPPYVLHVGDRISLPRPQVYVVQRGDTLYGIARSYGVDMRALAGLNRLGPPYNIWVGQRLALPSAAEVQVASGASTAPRPQARPVSSTTGTASTASGRPSVAASPSASTGVTPLPKPAATAAAQPAARAVQPPQPPPRSGRTFGWPVEGRVIANYGPSAGGTRNDGINISVAKGASVRAAENGVVVYAGNELKGFGNLLLVKHSDGWMTAYAHNDSLLAKKGDTVSRGQVIARAGQTGNVDSPQVHFEVRRNSKAVDPMEYLEQKMAQN